MQLKTRIKVNSIANLSDARYFATFAEWAGFNFNPVNAGFIPISTARELIGWMSGPRIVGEFGDASIEQVNQTAVLLGLDSIQMNHAIDYRQLAPIISTIIRQVFITPHTKAEELQVLLDKEAPFTASFLLNFKDAGISWESLQQADSKLRPKVLNQLCKDYNIILQLPFHAGNVLKIVDEISPSGIAVDSGEEIKTGIRSFEDIAGIIEQLEI